VLLLPEFLDNVEKWMIYYNIMLIKGLGEFFAPEQRTRFEADMGVIGDDSPSSSRHRT
jgi:hypothetical protein